MKKAEEFTLLYEISQALSESLDLRKSLYKALDILSNSMDMVRGTVTILNPLRNEISIEVAHGMSRVAMERGKYQIGEGVTGRVIQTGEASLVPKISQEPLFTENQPGAALFGPDSYEKGCPRSGALLHLCSSKKGKSGGWDPER